MAKTFENLIKNFFENYSDERHKKGKEIIYKDDKIEDIIFLKSGYVRQYSISSLGDELIIHVYAPGSFLPLTNILEGIPNHYYFTALTDVTYLKTPKSDFLEFMNGNPQTYRYILSKMLRAIDGLIYRVEHLAFSNSIQKVSNSLLFLDKHFGDEVAGERRLKYKFTHKEIASFATLTRETTSREIQKLRDMNIINIKKRIIYIRDRQKLEDLINNI